MHRLALFVLVIPLGACKSKPAADTAGSGSAKPVVVADAAAVVVAVDAAPPPTIDAPPPVEPPTAESVHVEVGRALRAWVANPQDKALYAADFLGRNEPDSRVEKLKLDAWLAAQPAAPKIFFSEVKSWLDAGAQLGEGETKTHVSYWYDGKSDYRELVYKREGGVQKLLSIDTNSRNSMEADKVREWRNYFTLDGKSLGKEIKVSFRIEGDLVWLVATGATQIVADMWPQPGSKCEAITPPPKDTLAQVRCTGVGEGQDFTAAKDKDSLVVRLTPASKDAPMSTDRRIDLAKGAKVSAP